jgi:hypothetical protein
MPCRSYEDEYPVPGRYRNEITLKENNDKLAALLCEACKLVDSSGYKMSNKLQEWWDAHQEADKKAQELEEKRLMADLAKQQNIKRDAERRAAEIRKLLKKK